MNSFLKNVVSSAIGSFLGLSLLGYLVAGHIDGMISSRMQNLDALIERVETGFSTIDERLSSMKDTTISGARELREQLRGRARGE